MTLGILEMDSSVYHADLIDDERPSLSSGIANCLIRKSPKHAWTAHPRLNPDYQRRYDEKFDVGTVCHALLLEGVDAIQVVAANDWRTNAAKAERDEARLAGRVPLLAHQVEDVYKMVDAVGAQLKALRIDPPLLSDGLPEQTLVWEDRGGVLCRARLDWLRDDRTAIDDLKTTTASANPEMWSRTLFNMGADVQAVFYLRGLRAVTGANAEFRWIVAETYPPFAISVVSLNPASLALADSKVNYAIDKWRECLGRDSWPSYPAEVCYAELPVWEETRWLEREAREAL